MFLLSCAIALAVDPLFFYNPVVDGRRKCLNLDHRLEITACVLRTFNDAFYILHMIFQFCTAFISPSSRVFGRGELIEDPWAIARRYFPKYFIIDVLAILPLPQHLDLFVCLGGNLSYNSQNQSPVSLVTKDLLESIILPQYVPRTIRIFPLYKEVTRTSGILTETAWAGAALNLFLYMLASHVVGAFLYLISIEREDSCWRNAIGEGEESALYCDNHTTNVNTTSVKLLNASCPFINPDDIKDSEAFNFGIFINALESGWWKPGIFRRNSFTALVGSLGQNLKTSTFVWEILFAIVISIGGLVLFSLLIGNMQEYLQSTGVRVEEMRVKRQDEEQWMSHRMLPDNLREPGTLHGQELHRPGRRSIEEMLFIIRGNLISTTTNGGRTGFFNSIHLKAGDFCGDDLLTWALDLQSSSNLPISTRTLQALTEVEAFALMAGELKLVASQFWRLHSKQFRHTFKFYSVQWQTWAASFIQAAWRRYCKRKFMKSLREAEDKLQDALAKESRTSPSLSATLYASKFAANALRTLRNNGSRNTRLPQRLQPLLLQKPAEPDFAAEDS
ncbi:putative cyclic nucleotide-gated ion channel 10 [Hibiscus syriacus]|uniref:Cyclic nucleotide-gated ion channel 10 n=1 Tax=Hibiscus syriacus TaxID=106335 RepID=A0A6A3AZV3_HIBSY|nr:putative cyclic nucleotide-gated ion channel 10 [Hibiscus syriacus]